jgi:hypothetical protein
MRLFALGLVLGVVLGLMLPIVLTLFEYAVHGGPP